MFDCDTFAIVLGKRTAMDAQGIFGGFGAEIGLLLFHSLCPIAVHGEQGVDTSDLSGGEEGNENIWSRRV